MKWVQTPRCPVPKRVAREGRPGCPLTSPLHMAQPPQACSPVTLPLAHIHFVHVDTPPPPTGCWGLSFVPPSPQGACFTTAPNLCQAVSVGSRTLGPPSSVRSPEPTTGVVWRLVGA